MTREEAIAFGKRVIDLGLNDETAEFCEMAITALSAEGEYIKKEDAINICRRACEGDMDIDEWIEREINGLPTYSL